MAGFDDAVDLLPLALADVADPDGAAVAVEREPPRVAQADAPDARLGARAIDVEAQHLAEQRAAVLGVAELVVAAAAVAGAEPQPAVGSEVQLAAVVVARLAVPDRHERAPVRAAIARRAPLGDRDVAGAGGRVVQEEAMVGRELRVEGDRQQAALATRLDA